MNDTVLEAARRMQAGKETAALVFDVDSDPHEDGLGDLAGIFTSKDLVLRVVAAGLNPATTTVARVMTPHPDCVTPDTRVVEALRKMHASVPILHLKQTLFNLTTITHRLAAIFTSQLLTPMVLLRAWLMF